MVLSGILLACVAAGGTLAVAGARHVPRFIVGTAILAGWVPLAVILLWLARTDSERAATLLAALGWAGFVALGVWFISGGARSSAPSWPWVCPDCRYANSRGALRCEACGTAWEPESESDGRGGPSRDRD